MACTERRRSHVGMVVMMLGIINGVSCDVYDVNGTLPDVNETLATSTLLPEISVNSTTTSEQDVEEDVTATPLSLVTTQCVLVALDPFQAARVHDLVHAEDFKLLEYKLVFPNNTVNPLMHNMKHAFKVSHRLPYSYDITLHNKVIEDRRLRPRVQSTARIHSQIRLCTAS